VAALTEYAATSNRPSDAAKSLAWQREARDHARRNRRDEGKNADAVSAASGRGARALITPRIAF